MEGTNNTKDDALACLGDIDWMAVWFKRAPIMPTMYTPGGPKIDWLQMKTHFLEKCTSLHGLQSRGVALMYFESRQRFVQSLFEGVGIIGTTLHKARIVHFKEFLDAAMTVSGLSSNIPFTWSSINEHDRKLYPTPMGCADAYMATVSFCERCLSDAANIMVSTQADITHGLNKIVGCLPSNRDSIRVRYVYALLNQTLALLNCAALLRPRVFNLPDCVEASDAFLSLLRSDALARRCEIFILRNSNQSVHHRLSAAARVHWIESVLCMRKIDHDCPHVTHANLVFINVRIALHERFYRIWQAQALQENIAVDENFGKSLFVLTHATSVLYTGGDNSSDEEEYGDNEDDLIELHDTFYGSLKINMWTTLQGLAHFSTGEDPPRALFSAADKTCRAMQAWAATVQKYTETIYFQRSVTPNEKFPDDMDPFPVASNPDAALDRELLQIVEAQRTELKSSPAFKAQSKSGDSLEKLARRVEEIRLQNKNIP